MRNAVFFLTILLAPCVFGAGLAGTWEGAFADAQKSHAGFDLEVSGTQVTGDAYLPGVYGHVAGRVSGNKFSFTLNGTPFEGTIDGDTMSLASGQRAATLQRTVSHVTGPVTTGAMPNDLVGQWTSHWTGRIGTRPKMIGTIRFEFKNGSDGLTGVAHMGPWPGDCPLSDVKLDQGRISFTATGLSPSSSGIPIMLFEGEIHGKELVLNMRHQIFGGAGGAALPMDVVRE